MVLRFRLRRAFRRMIRRKRKTYRKRFYRKTVRPLSYKKGLIQEQKYRFQYTLQTLAGQTENTMFTIHPFRTPGTGSDASNAFPLEDSLEYNNSIAQQSLVTLRWMKVRFIPFANVQGGASTGVRVKASHLLFGILYNQPNLANFTIGSMQTNDRCKSVIGDKQNSFFQRGISKMSSKIFSLPEYQRGIGTIAEFPGLKFVLRVEHTGSGAVGQDIGDIVVSWKSRFKWRGVITP